jgi:hypothetical protein
MSAPSQAPKLDKAAPFPSAASVAALGRPTVANDIRHTIAPSLQQGASSVLGMLGDLRDMPGKVNSAAVDFLVSHGMASPQAGASVKAAVSGAQRAVTGGPLGLGNPMAAALPDTARVNAARQGIVGKDYIPQTIPGQYVRTAGQFAPAAILPGSIAQRATNVLLPAITSETAGQVTKGTPYEEAARFVGGLVGGVRAPGAAATVESLPGLPGRMAARSIVDPTAVQVLKNAGVKLTPGQQLGGIAKNVEDLGMRAPILGPAISGARQRGNVSLNRAVANDALSDIGETVPANVATGHDSTAFVAERLGKVYDRAADMVPSVAPDAEFNVGLNEIDKHVGELPTDVGAQYRTILQNRLFSRLGNGPVTGAQLRQIQSEIGTIAAERAASGDGAQQALGHMLEGVSDNLKGLLGRANPEAGALIQQANAGWSKYVRIRNATAKTPSGIYTPGQLATAVRTMDKSVGKGNVAKGQAVLQDLSKAASTVMPDQFGNPGTANALGLGGMMVGATTAPVQTAVTAAGLGAVATPYALMARNISKAVPRTAPTTAQIAKAQALLEAHARRQLPPGLTPLVPSALLGGVLAR